MSLILQTIVTPNPSPNPQPVVIQGHTSQCEYGDTATGSPFDVTGNLDMSNYLEISVTNVGDTAGVLYTQTSTPQFIYPGQVVQFKVLSTLDVLAGVLVWDATGTILTFQTIKR